MRAIVVEEFGGPEGLLVKEINIPKPEDNQVLIKVEACSVNFADIKARSGVYHGVKMTPFIPGIDAAGIVEEVGSNVKKVKKGDRVFAFPQGGSYAEYIVADELLVFPISDNVSSDVAAACPIVSFTSYSLLHKVANVNKDDTILIHAAAGGIGTTIIQLAKLFGIKRVIGTVSSDEKGEIAKEVGADFTINYTNKDFSKVVLELTDGRGADVIFDSVGGDVFNKSLSCLAMFGKIVNFGAASGSGGQVNTQELHASCRSVLGFSLGTTRSQKPESLNELAKQVIPYIERSQLTFKIGGTFPLEHAMQAHQLIESRKSFGKILLKP